MAHSEYRIDPTNPYTLDGVPIRGEVWNQVAGSFKYTSDWRSWRGAAYFANYAQVFMICVACRDWFGKGLAHDWHLSARIYNLRGDDFCFGALESRIRELADNEETPSWLLRAAVEEIMPAYQSRNYDEHAIKDWSAFQTRVKDLRRLVENDHRNAASIIRLLAPPLEDDSLESLMFDVPARCAPKLPAGDCVGDLEGLDW